MPVSSQITEPGGRACGNYVVEPIVWFPMSIAHQEAGDDCAGQKNWGGSWRADRGPGREGATAAPSSWPSAPVRSSCRGNKLLCWPQPLKIFVLIHLVKLSQQHTQPDKVPHYRALFATSQWLPLHLFSKLITRAHSGVISTLNIVNKVKFF